MVLNDLHESPTSVRLLLIDDLEFMLPLLALTLFVVI